MRDDKTYLKTWIFHPDMPAENFRSGRGKPPQTPSYTAGNTAICIKKPCQKKTDIMLP